MVLVAQKSLTFSLFESSEFRDFIRTAIDLGKRYVPVTSYSLKQHIETVYDETKSDVRRFLLRHKGRLHLSIDSCTFNTTKVIFNVVVMDDETEWYLGYAEVNNLKKDHRAMKKLFTAAIKMVEDIVSEPVAPNQTVTNISTSSVQGTSLWEHIPSIPSQVSTLSTDQLFTHPLASLIVDGAAVNKKALEALSEKYPDLITICSAHGMNLMMKHVVKNTPWMQLVFDQAHSVIKYFRTKSRPRQILKMIFPDQLKSPAPTRFCYPVLSIQSFLRAAPHLRKIGASTLTDPSHRSDVQKEWIKLRAELSGKELVKFGKIQQLICEGNLYDRAESLHKILMPIYLLLRLFDRSSPNACGWVFCSLLHLRQVLKETMQREFQSLQLVGFAESLSIIDERIKYLATPVIILAFFLNPMAMERITLPLLDNFWKPSQLGQRSQIEHCLDIASNFWAKIFSSRSPHVRARGLQEFQDFQAFCKSTRNWGVDQENHVSTAFPLLSKIRMRLITSPAVSSSSERGFSTIRRIETTDRNRLSERTTEMLAFLNINLRTKIRKTHFVWIDIEKALYPNESLIQSMLQNDVDETAAAEIDSSGESIRESSSSDELSDSLETLSDPSDSDLQYVEDLNGSPDFESNDHTPFLRLQGDSFEFRSPFLSRS